MKKRQLGTSTLLVSEVGLGCMSLGTNEQDARSIVDAALEEGINFLDTADLYDYGLNEEFVGNIVKGRREKVIIATKGGNRWNEKKDGWFWDASKIHIKNAAKESLRRLRTDYIDLYQLHGGTIEDRIDETIAAFDELQQEGYIRHYGISSIRPNVIREYVAHSRIVSVLMEYSILNRRPEELFPLLSNNQISVIARGPLAKGLLTDAYPLKLQNLKNGYLSYDKETLQAVTTELQTAFSRPLHEIALQYCLHNPIVATVIPGASSLSQLRQNATIGAPLTPEAFTTIQSITRQDQYELHR